MTTPQNGVQSRERGCADLPSLPVRWTCTEDRHDTVGFDYSSHVNVVLWDGAADQLVQHAYEGLLVVGNGIDHLFGNGTAARMGDAAKQVGATVEGLAKNVHGAIATFFGAGKDTHDRLGGRSGRVWGVLMFPIPSLSLPSP